MEYQEIDEDRIPVIGIGPMICYYTKILKTNSNSAIILQFFDKLLSKIYYQFKEQIYIKSVSNAINSGFNHIDYSAAYGDGSLIRKAIKKSGIERNELWITTRITNQAQYTHNVRTEFFKQLKGLKVSYVDLLQFHWPVPEHYIDTWKIILQLQREGYCKHVGVANCNIHHLENLYNQTGVFPEINQFEVHPLLTQKSLIKYCKEKGIVVEAYTAIARADERLLRLPRLQQIAKKYNKSAIQIILRWQIQQGNVAIVRSMNKKRQKQDLDIFDFYLTTEEMHTIDSFNINSRLRFDPDNCDYTIL